ncbi:MAG: AraC family transcriptional regulator, partial [Intestinibacter bartlettii]
EGDAVFINSNVLHYIKSHKSDKCTLNTLVFNKSLIAGGVQSVFEQNFVNPIVQNKNLNTVIFYKYTTWGKEAKDYIHKAFVEFEESKFGYEMLVREYLSHMWYVMLKNIQDLNLNKKSINNLNSDRIKSMLSFIHKNYNKQITLNDISKSVNLSERECLRCFKSTLGISPIQYILKYRVSIAVKMLSESKDSITVISDTVGFDSPSYFSKIFKRFIGTTPSQYRKKSTF